MNDDPVILALTEQVSFYRRLAKLAEIQHQYVQDGQTEGLLDVLRSRQLVLDQLAACEKRIAPAKVRWAEYCGGLDGESRTRAEGLLAETRSLLEKITAADRDDVMVLQQQKLGLGRQIRQANAARQLNRNYAAAAYGKSAPKVDLQR